MVDALSDGRFLGNALKMLAKECTVPDVHADTALHSQDRPNGEVSGSDGFDKSVPSILGIWRLGHTLYRSNQCILMMGQPADAIDSPRWDYVIKTFPNASKLWQSKQHVSRVSEVSSLVRHPNLMVTLDSSATANTPYLVMPRLDGKRMQDQLQRGEATPLPIAIWITRQISEALNSLHQAGWIHGNVSPNHILLSSNGHATLIDLGLAQPIHTVTANHDRIDRGFAAPEWLSGDLAAIPAMDVFSLGRVLWSWLTATSSVSPAVLDPIATLIESMVAIDPAERPLMTSVIKTLRELEIMSLGQHIVPNSALKVA